jgi:hypothetical protein
MKALTIWQPWASLIMLGAKPYEFRRWPAPRWTRGQRIVIHAGARPTKLQEVWSLLRDLETDADGTALKPDIARPFLQRVFDAGQGSPILPLGCGLGTAVLGEPRKATELFAGTVADSDRIDQHVYGWPLTEIERWDEPVPAKGAQGFWPW